MNLNNIEETGELQEFQVDKNIIEHLIHSQSSDLDKAFVELVQNSIDSGSKNISIEIKPSTEQEEDADYDYTDWNFVLIDDGAGMQTDEDFITNLSVFGLKKDNRSETNQFGRFSMGRGQILKFGPVSWISGNRTFSVDLKEKGLGYHFSRNKASFPNGCRVEGVIDHKSHHFHHIDSLKNRLQNDLKFISPEIKILFNGDQLNNNSRKLSHHEPGLFRLYEFSEEELSSASSSLKDTLIIHNMGVFVLSLSSIVEGHLVVDQHLQLNTSRDSVLYGSCPVWKLVDHELDKITKQRLKTISNFTIGEIKALIQSIYKTRYSNLKVHIDVVFDKPIFPINNRSNRKLTFRELSENDSQLILLTSGQIERSQAIRQLADKIIQSLPETEVMIVKVDIFDSVHEFVSLLESFLENNYNTKKPTDQNELDQFNTNRKAARAFLRKIRELTAFNHLLAGGDTIIDDSEIKDKNTLQTLHAFRNVYSLMRSELGHRYGWAKIEEGGEWQRVVIEKRYSSEFLFKRKLFLSSLPTHTRGNTDGETIIRIDADYFRSQITSVSGLENIITLIMHEMCHSKQFGTLDEHNLEFYQTYHYMSRLLNVTEMVQKAAIQILRHHLKNDIPYTISQRIIDSVKVQATNERNLVDSINKLNRSNEIKKHLKKSSKSNISKNLWGLIKAESLQKHNGYAYYKEYYYLKELESMNDQLFDSFLELIDSSNIYYPTDNKYSFHSGHQKIVIATKKDLANHDPKRPWRTKVDNIYGQVAYFTCATADFKFSFLIVCSIKKKTHLLFIWEDKFNHDMEILNNHFEGPILEY